MHHAPARGAPAEASLAAARSAIPELARDHVPRPRLLEVLTQATSLPLVVVSAPAGTGKTTLMAEWARSQAGTGPIGWITFDDSDTALWDVVLECLGRLGLDVPTRGRGTTMDTALGRPDLVALAAAVAAAPERLTVVVDGYEMVSLTLAREVDFLLQHTAGQLCLVLIGRVDPVLPLYRYRLTDHLLEIRIADLAFTDEEAAQLMQCMGVGLSRESVHDLNERVKGWAAGLRLAARTLAGREDLEESVATVVAQTTDINEYLLGEVLDVQPPEVRRFLLDTCVPDVLCPGLVEELAGASGVHILRQLAKSNAFIERVPGRLGCYRYYPFFRDLLRAQLAYEAPQAMIDLHRKAARWLRSQGLLDQSIGHLATIAAWDEVAAEIVNDLLVGRLLLEGQAGLLNSLGRQLPDDLEQPAAHVVRAAVALAAGERTLCAEELLLARRAPQALATKQGALQLSISVLDAIRGSLSDSAETASELAEEADRALSGWRPSSGSMPDSALYALIELSKGITLIRLGDLQGARQALTEAVGRDTARLFAPFRADCLGYLAVIEALEGYLSRAHQKASESLLVAANAGIPPEDRSPPAYVTLAWVALERYELKKARQHIAAVIDLPALQRDRISRWIAEGVVASFERARGRLQPALARLAAAATRAAPTDPWLADYLRVEAAKLSLASGQLELATHALEQVLEPGRPEVAMVAGAVDAELGRDAAVQDFLGRVRDVELPLRARVTELLVEAVQVSRGQSPGRARVVLGRSLRLAAPEELRRPFREAGPAVQRLLSADTRLVLENRWLSPGPATGNHPVGPHEPDGEDRSIDVIEILTAKEAEVLGHLQELLTTEEIAEKMFVSVNTVRTHVRSILRKLGVSRRNAAVRKARELGIVKG